MSVARHHAEWLSLLEISGPFLSMPVLLRVLPRGLDEDDPDQRRELQLPDEVLAEGQAHSPRPESHHCWATGNA